MSVFLLSEEDRRIILELLQWKRSLNGPGMTNAPDSVSFSVPKRQRGRVPLRTDPSRSPLIPLRIDAIQADLGNDRYSYQWTEMEPAANGSYTVKSGGRDYTTHGLAYNDYEYGNSTTWAGNIKRTDLPEDTELTVSPVSDRTPVVWARLIRVGGNPEARFWYPTPTLITCTDD